MNQASHAHKVLASVELDSTADVVLEQAFDVLRGHENSELHLVHVVPADGITAAEQVAVADNRLTRATEGLKNVLERTHHNLSTLRTFIHVRIGNDPARSLLQAAVDVEADIMVIGSHRRRGLERLLLGSVAERVLKDAHCPVLVALSKDYSHDKPQLTVEPPCEDCLAIRRATSGERFWCERHSRTYQPPHLYVPSDRGRQSIMPSS